MVGSMALYTPQVLGAGHGALGLDFYWPMSARELAILIALKLLACLVSLASGFRGGLFFASLFVGSLLGKLYSIGIDALAPSLGLETTACVLVGMGALSAAIVGGPLTMTFLVLESTGNLGVAGGVLAASIATTLAVRATFGYSFTTWRLHLRGETIRGGQDVGWLRDLTVGRMMVRSPPVFPADRSVRAFREAYPIGSANVVVAIGEDGRYQGLIHVAEAHAAPIENGDDGGPVGAIAHLPATVLHLDQDIGAALKAFDVAQADMLAVTARGTGQVLGTLGEAYAARRYAQETNLAMKGVLGGGVGRDGRFPATRKRPCSHKSDRGGARLKKEKQIERAEPPPRRPWRRIDQVGPWNRRLRSFKSAIFHPIPALDTCASTS